MYEEYKREIMKSKSMIHILATVCVEMTKLEVFNFHATQTNMRAKIPIKTNILPIKSSTNIFIHENPTTKAHQYIVAFPAKHQQAPMDSEASHTL